MIKALKSKTFYMLRGMKETCTEVMSSRRGPELPPLLPLRTTHKVPVTVQEDVDDTKIWSHCINVSLYWNAGWKKGTTFCERMSLKFPWLFYEFFKTWSQFPWLFQAWKRKMEFHDSSRFSMTGYTLIYPLWNLSILRSSNMNKKYQNCTFICQIKC